MKTYPYSRTSHQGRRLYQLLYSQYNKATIVTEGDDGGRLFEERNIPSVMQCRANKVSFIVQGNSAGIKRPHVRIEADVEQAWGEFTDEVSTLDFKHNDQELPLVYTQPIENDTMKLLIDAGFYDDSRFEPLLSKIADGMLFEAEGNMRIVHIEVGDEQTLTEHGRETIPFVMVEPVTVIHDEKDQSNETTIQSLLKRSAMVAIELRKDGHETSQLVEEEERDLDREVYLRDVFEDVVEAQVEQELDTPDTISVESEFLDQEIDVTDKLKGNIDLHETTEDDKIRDLKEKVIGDEEFEADEPEVDDEHTTEEVDFDDFDDFEDIDDYDVDDSKSDDGPEF